MNATQAEKLVHKLKEVDIIDGNLYVATVRDGFFWDEVNDREVPQSLQYFGMDFRLEEHDSCYTLHVIA